jgi:hypothetical protein
VKEYAAKLSQRMMRSRFASGDSVPCIALHLCLALLVKYLSEVPRPEAPASPGSNLLPGIDARSTSLLFCPATATSENQYG